ncbi:hypothetical protein BN9982_230024 [Mycobacterium tuberculosis]|nr:hypothetical protein BN9982_230024 [Mycobacterium tuberculosis]
MSSAWGVVHIQRHAYFAPSQTNPAHKGSSHVPSVCAVALSALMVRSDCQSPYPCSDARAQ